jgi:hypothetical protein
MHTIILKNEKGRIVKVFLTSDLSSADLSELEVAAAFKNQDLEYLEVEEVPYSFDELLTEIKAQRGW